MQLRPMLSNTILQLQGLGGMVKFIGERQINAEEMIGFHRRHFEDDGKLWLHRLWFVAHGNAAVEVVDT